MYLKDVVIKKTEAHRNMTDLPKSQSHGLFVRIRLEQIWSTLHNLGLKPEMILCLCCGYGREIGFFLDIKRDVIGLDISPNIIKYCKQKYRNHRSLLSLLVGDAEALPFMDECFDFGLVVQGLHHLPHPYKGLKELSRVSKKALALVEIVEPLITKILKHLPLFKTEHYRMEPNRLNIIEINNILLSQGLTVKKTIHQFGYLPGFFKPVMSYRLELTLFKLQQTILRVIPSLSKVFYNEVVMIAYKKP